MFTLIFTVVMLALYLWARSVSRKQESGIRFYCDDKSPFVRALLTQTDIKNLKYTPHWLCVNNHVQCLMYMVYVEFCKMIHRVQYAREVIRLSDQEAVTLEWHNHLPQKGDNRPILVVLPGIGGTSQNSHSVKIIEEASSKFQCVFVWPRCRGNAPIYGDKLFCFASWRDIRDVVNFIHTKYKRDLYLFATSLGASVTTNYLINEGSASPLKAVCLYATPLDIEKNSKFWESTANGQYDHLVARKVIQWSRPALEKIASRVDEQRRLKIRMMLDGKVPINFYSLDQFINAPLYGYESLKEYRKDAEVGGRLHKIKVPCMWLHAMDDAFLGPDSVPFDEFATNPNLILATTESGSHGSHFVGGSLFGLLPTMWHHRPILEFLFFAKRHI